MKQLHEVLAKTSVATAGCIDSIINRILTNDLKMFLYKIHIYHSLNEYAKDVRVDFFVPFL
jgi:hypothetical protein